MRNRWFPWFGVAALALAWLLAMSFVPQSVHASEFELMPYEVLRGPMPPQFDGDPPAETRVVVDTPDPVLGEVGKLLLEGLYDEALNRLDGASVLEETKPRASYYRALALCATKRIPSALAIQQSEVFTSPYQALMHYALGCAYLNLSGRFDSSNPDEALSHLSVAAKLLPCAGGVRFYIGLALLELKEYEEAVEMLRESASANPAFADAHLNLGLALVRLGQTEDALDALLTARDLRQDDSQIHMAIGDVHFTLGNYEAAVDSYRSASISPDGFLSAQYKMSLALLRSGDAAQSQAIAADLVSRYPRHFDGHVVLGRARLALGNAEGAIQAFESALWLRPGHFNTRLDLASAHLALPDPDKAGLYLEEALEIYAGDAHAYMLLARVRELQGDTDGARSAAQKSVQIEPDNQSARELYERLK